MDNELCCDCYFEIGGCYDQSDSRILLHFVETSRAFPFLFTLKWGILTHIMYKNLKNCCVQPSVGPPFFKEFLTTSK